jgi:hypothetical protein
MNATLFLRIAAVLTLLHCIAHTYGGVLAGPRHGAPQIAVMEAMKSQKFDFAGSMRGYWDFYRGYALFVSFSFLAQTILFWQLGSVAQTGAFAIRGIIAVFFLEFVGFAILAVRYFFLPALAVEILIAISLAAAFFTAGAAPAP